MTDLEMEIQKLRRELEAIKKALSEERWTVQRLQMDAMYHKSEIVRLRREVEYWQAKSEEWKG